MICGLRALEKARVRVLGADQKKSRLCGRECEMHNVLRWLLCYVTGQRQELPNETFSNFARGVP